MHLARPAAPRLEPIQDLLPKIRERQKDSPVNAANVVATLAHNRSLNKAFGTFAQGCLFDPGLPRRIIELAVLRMGWNCQAIYEFGQHTLFGRDAGLSDAEIYFVTRPVDQHPWVPEEAIVLQVVDDLYADDCVSDATWAQATEHYDASQLIHLLMAAGCYRVVSGLLNSAGVRTRRGRAGLAHRPHHERRAIVSYPLEGVKVLDFTRVLAGPFATRILSDLGADVLKVEPPEGDMTRALGRKVAGLSGYFTQQNVGKRAVCIDLSKPGAADLVKQLVVHADVVTENFRPGVMASFGIGWDDLVAVNPKLVMMSISGFGQQGPERERASYAPIIHAEMGLLQRQQYVTGADKPVDLALSVADTSTGLHGLVGLLAALHHAQRTGQGQHVDMAMINALFFTDDYVHGEIDHVRPPAGGGIVFDATGGPIMLAGDEKWYWRVFNTRAGLVDPTPEGADLPTKIACRRQAIEQYLLSFPDRASLIAKLNEVNLAWGEVFDHREVLDKQGSIEGRQILVEVDDRDGGTRKVTNTPYRFSDAEAGARRAAPFQGEHNYEALSEWLGLAATDIDRLHEAGVLLQDERAAHLNDR